MSSSARIVITGDVHLGGGRVREYARQKDVDRLFGEFLPLLRSADLAVTNLESPVISGGTPIPKTGPNLKSPPDTLQVLKEAGFDLVTLANNHIMDYGEEGLDSTLNACKSAGLESVGAGLSELTANQPYSAEINGLTISILNIAENEFGTSQNGEPGGHAMDPVQNYYAIRQAKEEADRVIVIVHGGHEHYELPSPRMKKTYRFYADAGADAVIGHHTHCISGYERYNSVPIVYSLGNFLFDKDNGAEITDWNMGLICTLTFSKKGETDLDLQPYIQGARTGGLEMPEKQLVDKIQSRMASLNTIIAHDDKLEESFEAFCNRSKRLYSSYIEPHSLRLVHALRNRNLLPPLLSKRKKLLYKNLVRCEAHRDILIKTLTS
jgi:poly-gamma-glutamate synthesis protein (capsule biosynthesis protein)